MAYIMALIVYIASIAGVLISMGGMFAAKDDAKLVGFFSLCSIVFSFTTYLGGTMLQNIN
jgi:hypothetical protein